MKAAAATVMLSISISVTTLMPAVNINVMINILSAQKRTALFFLFFKQGTPQ
jgi:hypothetical protein